MTEPKYALKAKQLWDAMTPSERHGVKFGLFPHDAMVRAEREGYDGRLLVLALMERA
jgi:hypothetical protein